ncbi:MULTISPECIES: ribosome-associated heat shock protein Hsp15 [unclassified Pseudoalteromonas]|uniref:ribosome-associated heat shock protein Hsp15 n=1 Tax=unclassified Pseudoalteromonas TaxID=194690 RepID=UPI0006DD2548|nr:MULTISPECIES: ribosome-associated heat shock protein Hsp15 [unclassified Pseudoalteromonas]KPV97221.1 Heat shock protein 15 [Pseudoalteromonas sp. P1-11]MDC9566440.1 ribosome-associated heat shock protein Hsp15 [Pseudoalteromonas sp. GAB2316C]MDC9570713.1 ribosome-associated heat shock protein Hsp15 [Pseudoalteromonas sp. GABNB9D]MDC9574945.1 ribosome-associated heat shock protein Hsp15 [Pseudoalteromonas sp. GABNS16A]MDC9579202.1 ribosome-associated heat shock protein Hsp15 [Pseudoalteromo
MSKKNNTNADSDHNSEPKVRLDKWLWAARFYKTRALAREMVQGGKVHYNGQRTKASKTVEVGATIKLAQGVDEKLIKVLKVLEKRQSAPIAQTLYQETDASIAKREENAIARKNNSFFAPHPDKKPDKKQRRELLKMKSS